jgi:2,5-diamino-6-(ribosylamino)-4(3H)-pyrimidinone 5'-phosphate reductase
MAPRPRVLIDCATSLDGKLQLAPALRRPEVPFAMSRHPEDHRRMRALRSRADAIVIGAGNLRVDDPDLSLADEERARRAAAGVAEPLRVVITRSGAGIEPGMRLFDRALGGEPVVAHAATMPADRRRALAQVATLVEVGDHDVDVTALLAWLAEERACRVVLCEGGGVVNAAFFAARAVDEVFMTLVPRVLGGGDAPTLVDGPGFGPDDIPEAKLAELERIGDELFLRYELTW